MRKLIRLAVLAAALAAAGSPADGQQLAAGQPAPGFSLTALDGKAYDLSMLKTSPMAILYFFDADSKPSQEGLISLDRLARQHADAGMTAWAVTRSPRPKAAEWAARNRVGIPVLLDTTDASERYRARLVLPTVVILGPDQRVLDHIQGGGASTEIMLARLAERNLQRRQFTVAKGISDQVVRKDSRNLDAKAISAYASLKEGDLNRSRQLFQEVAQGSGRQQAAGVEGLAAVYAAEGQSQKALELARQVEQQAPDRGYAHLVRGDILYAGGQREAAEAEYRRAVDKKGGLVFQRVESLNRLGRLQAEKRDYDAARSLYNQAIDIDPYSIEATANKGMAFEREGRWHQALEAYQKALGVDRNDLASAVLARQAQEKLALQQDAARKKHLDDLVRELAERYRGQPKGKTETEDLWTSRPLVLTFVDLAEKGNLGERDGMAGVLSAHLAELLNASGRLRVVDRQLMDRLLEELNLGSSELSDPATALKLGRVLAARVIGTGALLNTASLSLVNLRLIDTETSAIAKVITQRVNFQAALEKDIFQLNREVLETLTRAYPLQGFIVRAAGSEVMLNIGQRQGVVAGTQFEVLKEAAPVAYKGKTLEGSATVSALLKVARVEPDLCHAQIVSAESPVRPDDKVREKAPAAP
jgi:tetratricopeptide (TPR) repeat protein